MSDQQFEDQQAIRALLDRYCDGVNQRDADIWGSTWARMRSGNCPIWIWPG